MKLIKKVSIFAKIILVILSVCIIFMTSGCSITELFEYKGTNSSNTDNSGNGNSNSSNTGNSGSNNSGSSINDNNNAQQSRTIKIYKESSDYKPTGTVDEQLIVSKLLIDLSSVIEPNFKGNLKLDFKVDLAYSKDFTTPSPTFTFFYYSKNEINLNYLLGQNTVTILSKTKKTYTFSLNVYLEGNVIYCARACNMDMGKDGNNIMGMYLDYRTYSLNNYFVTVDVNNSGSSTPSDNPNNNDNEFQPRKIKIYKESSDYKPTGTVNEPLIASRLIIDLSNVVGSDFKGNLKLDFTVDLAYSKDFTTPSPTFTFLYYSKNDLSPDYLLGQNTVTILSKTKKTYTFSLNIYLEGNIIYGGRACNMDMGYDGNNALGMYLDYRTYSLNNYYVNVTII